MPPGLFLPLEVSALHTPCVNQLHEEFCADFDKGEVFRRKSGERAGSFDGRYRFVRFKGASLREHRLIWALAHGEWPTHLIDHINGDGGDNRLENLRLATHGQNMQNRGKHCVSSSAFKGVYFEKESRKSRAGYRAQIRHDGKRRRSTSFDCPAAAAKQYDEWAVELHGQFARVNFPTLVERGQG